MECEKAFAAISERSGRRAKVQILDKFSREFRGSLISRLKAGETGQQKPPQFFLRGFL
ncbi:hypothetical protein D3C86_1597750 [compost metagenome]